MRPLFLTAACLFSFSLSFAQGVTQLEPTTADLARLMGDVTSLEIAVPEGANTVRIAYVMGDEGGHSEERTPLWLSGAPTTGKVMRLLLLAPGRFYSFECAGEPIDVLVVFGDHAGGGGSMCTPLLEGDDGYTSRRKHEHAFTGPTPQLEEWAPVYLRAWTPFETGSSGAGARLDLTKAFTIQLMFTAAEIEQVGAEPPLISEGLMRIPEVRRYVDPFAR
jgi:hypothetical protein